MSAMASQITGVLIVCSTVCSGADQRNHQRSASLAFVRVTGGFPSQRASNAENVSFWWRHHVVFCWGLVQDDFNHILQDYFIDAGTSMPLKWSRQSGRHFADDFFKYIFWNENVWFSTEISLTIVPEGPINDIPALVQAKAWDRPGDKPLSELMMLILLTHIWNSETTLEDMEKRTAWIP